MSKRRVSRRLSSFRLAATQRLRRSWTRWSLSRTRRRLLRAELRLVLLQVEQDSQLLRVKELAQQESLLRHRQVEHQQSLQFRVQGSLPPSPTPDPVRALLGL